jgi:glycosyltransferase involved in cell wall biosynthesis
VEELEGAKHKLTVSVVICTYREDRWDDLIAAVYSVKRQIVPAEEIIVVVDHNSSLFERVEREISEVVAVENRGAQGLSGARNSGLLVARGAVVAFLDDDAAAAPDWVLCLIEGYADPAIVGVGGAILPAWLDERPAWFPEELDWVVGCTYRGMPVTQSPVRNPHGANMSFRREVFSAAGLFRLGPYCDETEFCIRLRRHLPEAILLYEPRAKVFHTVPASRTAWKYVRWRCHFEGGSKAVVAWMQGAKDGLAAEWPYTLKTLPRGVVRGLVDASVRRDIAGLARSAAILACFAITTTGYIAGKISIEKAARERGIFSRVPVEAPI